MPYYNNIITCKTTDGKEATILPQSLFLVFENEMYNIIPHWSVPMSMLVMYANDKFSFVIDLTYKNTILETGEMCRTIQSFSVDIVRNGKLHFFSFQGTCYVDYRGRGVDIRRMMGYTHLLDIHDNRMMHWKCVQRFLRDVVCKRKNKKRLAVAMAWHDRLGEMSILRVLDIDLFARYI